MDTKPGSKAPLPSTIELRVEEISQLFDNLDPFPFRERDLDKAAEEYIVSWARELPRKQPIKITVHLPKHEAEAAHAQDVEHALTRYFKYRAESAKRDLDELFWVGRRALMIGLSVLAVSVLLGHVLNGRLGSGYFAKFFEQSLVIVGWVANWRPIEIFLYDWWPIARRKRLYDRLARAEVALKAV